MSGPNGHNPMQWKCEKQGCFNQKKRPKIEVFSDCFPGAINFGDVDAEVEINGYSLRMEWKSYVGTLPKGQSIMFERKTRYGLDTVICVCGDAESMSVTHYGMFFRGRWHGWLEGDMDALRGRIKGWVQWAASEPPSMTIAGIMRCVAHHFKIRDILNYMGNEIDRKERSLQARELKLMARQAGDRSAPLATGTDG